MDQAASPTRTWASSTPLGRSQGPATSPATARTASCGATPRRGASSYGTPMARAASPIRPWRRSTQTGRSREPEISPAPGEDGGVRLRNASTGGVELWNSNGSGGFTYQGLGACQHKLAGRGQPVISPCLGLGRHPLAQRIDRGRRAVEPQWLGRLHLRSSEPGQHQLAGRGNRRFHRQRRGQHPLAQFLDRRCRALGIRTARAASPTRTWAPSAPAGRFSNRG